jgi:hypothetical protein
MTTAIFLALKNIYILLSSVSLSFFSNRSTQQIRAESSSETLVNFYPITWHHSSEEHILTLTIVRTSDLIKCGYFEISNQY